MNKGLEALEELKQDLTPMHFSRIEKLDRYKIIEKELKEYEGAKNHIEALHKERVENSLKLKALEIIKKKPRLDLVYIRDTEDYNDYVMTLNIASYSLENEDVLIYATQEEYDLLSKVLL